jgi:hypothetical protein
MSGLPNAEQDQQIPDYLIPTLTWSQYLYPQQEELYFADEFTCVFVGGNGTGKTFLTHKIIADYLYGIHPNQPVYKRGPKSGEPITNLRIMLLVPDFDKINEVSLEKLLQPQVIEPHGIEIGPLIPQDMIAKPYSKDYPAMDLKVGSRLMFSTSQQHWKQHSGKQFDLLFADEEPEHRIFQENKRGLRNARGGGKIYMGFTPPYEEGKGPSWSKEEIIEAAVEDPDIRVVTACMRDNPSITEKYIREFTKGMPPQQVRVVVYGDYPSWGDLVHPDYKDQLFDFQKNEGHLNVDWVMAFDWHPSKPCAALWGYIDRGGNLTVFDELDRDIAKDKDIQDLARIFRTIEGNPQDPKEKELRPFRRWQDPSSKHKYKALSVGFDAWGYWRVNGIFTSEGKNREPSLGIGIVNEYFRGDGKQHPSIRIYERCKFLRQALRNHYWKRGEDGVGKPDPKWSDYPICLRYILQEVGWTRTKRKNKWPLQSFRTRKPQREIYNLGNIR